MSYPKHEVGDILLIKLSRDVSVLAKLLEVDLGNECYHVVETDGTKGEVYFDQPNYS